LRGWIIADSADSTFTSCGIKKVMPNISIAPDSIALGPSESQHFKVTDEARASVDVVWSLIPNEPATAGSIDESGLYQAPSAVSEKRTVAIKASDKADVARAAEASVTLLPKLVVPSASPPSASVKVKPETIVLGSGQTVTFQARDESGEPVSVAWSLAGAFGLGPDAVGSLGSITGDSTVYTAPAEVAAQRAITVTATGAAASDKAFIVLAPGKVTIIQTDVTLRAGERQVFQARVSGDPDAAVTWAAPSPSVGSLDEKGEYTAPDLVREDQTVIIRAVAKVSGDQASARITLLADPWTGRGPKALGIGLLALFVLAACVYYVWPPPLDRSQLNAAFAAQAAAERTLEQRQVALNEAKQTASRLTNQQAEIEKNPPDSPVASQALQALGEERRTADENVRTKTVEENLAIQDLKDKRASLKLEEENFKRAGADEQHLFLLVVLAGALGSFVHVTRSFVDFIGNRRLRPSWTWWYILQPFTGSALAVVVYLVLRGGFFVGTSAGGILNPFGFVAVAALVGLFSKQATSKLDELFGTMFRTDKERELKDKLNPQAKAEQQVPF
jgi:hypothetical protein